MCDTIVVVNPDGVLFAKNSDRDPNEAQFPEWVAAGDHDADDRVVCMYLEIPQARHTHAVLLSRPFWMWGAEIGSNEHAVRTISNGLTIPGFADAHRDRLRSKVSACDVRTALTARSAARAAGPAELMAVLRSHCPDVWPRYRSLNGTPSMPCMHSGGLVASSSSTAGWVSELRTGTHWITATSAQCLSLFKPVRVPEPVDIGRIPDATSDPDSLWWRHERMARTVMKDPATLAPLFLDDRNQIDARWLAEPPSGRQAFTEHADLLDDWSSRVADVSESNDTRPWFTRRYWSKRESALT